MFRSLGVSLIIFVAIAVSGCGVAESSKSAPNGLTQLTSGTWAGDANGATITVSLSKDGRFQSVFRGGDYRAVVKGKAKIEETKLILLASEFDGKPAPGSVKDKPAIFTFDPAWKTLTSEEGIVLNRRI